MNHERFEELDNLDDTLLALLVDGFICYTWTQKRKKVKLNPHALSGGDIL